MYGFTIAISLLLFLLASLYRREWGVYLIILLLPTYQIRFQVLGIPATFLEGMILLLACLSLRAILINDEPISLKNRLLHFIHNDKFSSVFIFLFLLAAGVSVFLAPDMARAAGIFKAFFFEAILFYFLVRLIIDSREKLEKLFQSLAVLVLYLSIFGLYQFLTLSGLPHSWWGVEIAERRIVSLVNHPNALALLLGPILAMLAFLPKNKLKYAAILFGLPAFYLTLSRAGWLALVAVIVGIGLFTQYKKKIIILALCAVIAILAIPYSRTKLANLASGHDPTQENRYLLWSAGIDLIKKHPLAGVGLMGFREHFKNYPIGPARVIQNYPHNFFLNFWVETGLLGLVSMISLLMLFYRKIYQLYKSPLPNPPPQGEGNIKENSSPLPGSSKTVLGFGVGLRGEDKGGGGKNYALAVVAAMAMIAVHSLGDGSYFKNDLAVLFWLIYALPFIVSV